MRMRQWLVQEGPEEFTTQTDGLEQRGGCLVRNPQGGLSHLTTQVEWYKPHPQTLLGGILQVAPWLAGLRPIEDGHCVWLSAAWDFTPAQLEALGRQLLPVPTSQQEETKS